MYHQIGLINFYRQLFNKVKNLYYFYATKVWISQYINDTAVPDWNCQLWNI